MARKRKGKKRPSMNSYYNAVNAAITRLLKKEVALAKKKKR